MLSSFCYNERTQQKRIAKLQKYKAVYDEIHTSLFKTVSVINI